MQTRMARGPRTGPHSGHGTHLLRPRRHPGWPRHHLAGPQALGLVAVGDLPADALAGPVGPPCHRPAVVAGFAAAHQLWPDAPAGCADRRRPEQPARGRGARPGRRPLLPLADLGHGAAALRGADRLCGVGGHARPALVGRAAAGLCGRHRRRPGPEHRARAGPQAEPAGAEAGPAGAGGAGLRPLHRRARPRPPPLGGHSGRPRQCTHGRVDLPVCAARAARRHPPRLGAGSRAPGHAGPGPGSGCWTSGCWRCRRCRAISAG